MRTCVVNDRRVHNHEQPVQTLPPSLRRSQFICRTVNMHLTCSTCSSLPFTPPLQIKQAEQAIKQTIKQARRNASHSQTTVELKSTSISATEKPSLASPVLLAPRSAKQADPTPIDFVAPLQSLYRVNKCVLCFIRFAIAL
jgi:hypothetical protein